MKESKKLAALFRRYDVKVRRENRTVKHSTYGFETILTPLQFAVFELALKGVYISNQCYHKSTGDYGRFHFFMVHHQDTLFDPNDIEVPYIEDQWGLKQGQEAAKAYHYAAGLLRNDSGINAADGKERNLYYAVLD